MENQTNHRPHPARGDCPPERADDPAGRARKRDGSSPALLLVDDSPGFLRAAARVLAGKGFDVKVATSAARAKEILAREPIEGVLLDVVLRGSDGLDLLRTLAADYPRVRASVVTGHLSARIIAEASSCGALDVLVKPVQGTELLQAASALLGDAAADSNPG